VELKKAKIAGQDIELAEDQAETKFLGSIFWFTVSGLEITRDDLKKKYEQSGVSLDLFPKPTRDIDAFKNAANDIDMELKKVNGNTLRIDKVRGNARARQLVDDKTVTKADGEFKPVLAEWTYKQPKKDDPGGVISRYYGNGEEKEKFEELDLKLRARWEFLKVIHTDKDIRDVLRDTLHKWYCVSLRPSGGVYFVAEQYTNELLALQKLLESIGSELWTVKVRDVANEKKLIYVKYEEEVKEKVGNMLNKITEILKDEDKDIYPSQFAQFADTLSHLKESKEEYESLLKMNMVVAETELDILQKQLGELAGRIKSKD
jgi:hypothetical protein